MKTAVDQTGKVIILTAEDDLDIYELGRIAQLTNTKADRNYNSQSKFQLEVSVRELLSAALKR